MKRNLTLLMALSSTLAWNYASGQSRISSNQKAKTPKVQVERIPLAPLQEDATPSTLKREQSEANPNSTSKHLNPDELFLERKELSHKAPKRKMDIVEPK